MDALNHVRMNDRRILMHRECHAALHHRRQRTDAAAAFRPEHRIQMKIAVEIDMIMEEAWQKADLLHAIQLVLAHRLAMDDDRPQVLADAGFLLSAGVLSDELLNGSIAVGVADDLPTVCQRLLEIFAHLVVIRMHRIAAIIIAFTLRHNIIRC